MNELSKYETNLPAAIESTPWGTENIDNNDIIIPRLLLMQGLSELVAQEKAQIGDIVHSLTETVLGGRGKYVEIVPFLTFKTVDKLELKNNKWELVESLPFINNDISTKYNNFKPFTYKDSLTNQDVTCKYESAINFYCFLYKELKNPDALPCIIKCKNYSKYNAQKIITFFKQCAALKIPPASYSWLLNSVKTQNSKGTFYIFEFQKGEPIDKEHLKKIYDWYLILQKTNYVYHQPIDDEITT